MIIFNKKKLFTLLLAISCTATSGLLAMMPAVHFLNEKGFRAAISKNLEILRSNAINEKIEILSVSGKSKLFTAINADHGIINITSCDGQFKATVDPSGKITIPGALAVPAVQPTQPHEDSPEDSPEAPSENGSNKKTYEYESLNAFILDVRGDLANIRSAADADPETPWGCKEYNYYKINHQTDGTSIITSCDGKFKVIIKSDDSIEEVKKTPAEANPKTPEGDHPTAVVNSNYEKAELATAVLRLIALQIDQHFGKRYDYDSKQALLTGLLVDVLRITNDILAIKTNYDTDGAYNGISAATATCVLTDFYGAAKKILKLFKKKSEQVTLPEDIKDTEADTEEGKELKSSEKLIKLLKAIAPSVEGVLAVSRAGFKFYDAKHSYKVVYLSTVLLSIIRALNMYSPSDKKNVQKKAALTIAGTTVLGLMIDGFGRYKGTTATA